MNMNKRLVIIVFALAALTGWAQTQAEGQVNSTTALLGSWSGKLKAGAMSLTLVLLIESAIVLQPEAVSLYPRLEVG